MDYDAATDVPQTTADLLTLIEAGWQTFDQAVNRLSTTQLTQIYDVNGWSVKDHIAHVRAWEQSLLALLEGRDRNAAVGLGPADDRDIDATNALIQQQSRQQSLDEVQYALRQSHAQVVAAVERLSDADLFKPYSAYQPNATDVTDPVIGWIIGNTYEHYAEHTAWIEVLVQSA